MLIDQESKINAVVHKVDELDHRIGDLEKHDKKSLVFSRNMFKRGFGIVGDALFFLIVLAVIGGLIFLGVIGLSAILRGTV